MSARHKFFSQTTKQPDMQKFAVTYKMFDPIIPDAHRIMNTSIVKARSHKEAKNKINRQKMLIVKKVVAA